MSKTTDEFHVENGFVVPGPDSDSDAEGGGGLRAVARRRPAKATLDAWWRIATAGALAIFLGLGLLYAVQGLSRILAMLVLAVSIAMALWPLVDWLEQWLPRTLAVLFIFFILLAVVVGIFWIVLPPLINQAQLLIDLLPGYIDAAQQWLLERNFIGETVDFDTFDRLRGFLPDLGGLGQTLIALPIAIASSIADILVIVFVSIYWLILMPEMRSFVRSLFPERQAEGVLRDLRRVGAAMGGYVRGALISALLVAVLVYIGVTTIIGLEFGLVLAVFAGVFEFIPVIGPIISGIPIVILALTQSPQTALFAAIFVLIVQQIESNIITPNVMKSQAHISPVLAILAIFGGHTIGGLLGAIVALPLVSAIQAFVKAVLAPALRRRSGAPPVEDE